MNHSLKAACNKRVTPERVVDKLMYSSEFGKNPEVWYDSMEVDKVEDALVSICVRIDPSWIER